MVIMNIINGDITDSEYKYIAQQCNCNTVKSYGLAKIIASKYPSIQVSKYPSIQVYFT